MDDLIQMNQELPKVSTNDIYNSVEELLLEHNVVKLDDFSEEIDSFAFIDLVVDLEDKFGISVETNELIMSKFCNINYITEYLQRNLIEPVVIDVTDTVKEGETSM